jgi:hypothetical protein
VARFLPTSDLAVAEGYIRQGHLAVADRGWRHQHDRPEPVNPRMAIQELKALLETRDRGLELLTLNQRDPSTMSPSNQIPRSERVQEKRAGSPQNAVVGEQPRRDEGRANYGEELRNHRQPRHLLDYRSTGAHFVLDV